MVEEQTGKKTENLYSLWPIYLTIGDDDLMALSIYRGHFVLGLTF